LHPLLGVQWRITEQSSVGIPVLTGRLEKMFSVNDEKRSIAAALALSAACSMLAVRRQRKALSPIRQRVGGTTRSPDDEARSADCAGTLATDDPGARFTKYLTIYREIISSLSSDRLKIMIFNVLRFLLGISQANVRTLSETILWFCK